MPNPVARFCKSIGPVEFTTAAGARIFVSLELWDRMWRFMSSGTARCRMIRRFASRIKLRRFHTSGYLELGPGDPHYIEGIYVFSPNGELIWKDDYECCGGRIWCFAISKASSGLQSGDSLSRSLPLSEFSLVSLPEILSLPVRTTF